MNTKGQVANSILLQNNYLDVPVLQAANVQSIAQVKTYPIDVQASRNIRNLILEIGGGLVPSDISQIRVKPNGLQWQTFSWEQLDLINQYFGQPVSGPDAVDTYRLDIAQIRQKLVGGESYISFSQQTFMSGAAGDLMESTTLNCGVLNSANQSINLLKVEVDVLYDGGDTPFISILELAEPPYNDGQGSGAGLLKVIDQMTVTIGVGQVTLLKSNGLLFGDKKHSILDVVFLFAPLDPADDGTYALFDSFQVWYQGNEIRQRSAADNAFIQGLGGYRVQQQANGLYAIDFTEMGLGDKSLPTSDPGTDLFITFQAAQSTSGAALPGVLTIIQFSNGYMF